MPFNLAGFVLASALTQNLADRDKASQLSLLGGVLGNSPVGLVLVASAAQQDDAPGDTEIIVPDVRGKSQADGKELVAAAGFVPVIEAAEEPVAKGLVQTQEPAGGSLLSGGADVVLFVVGATIVPDVVGKQQQEGESAIRAAGFVPVVKAAEQPGSKGLVQAQEPAGGSLLSAGSEVLLFVVGADTGKVTTTAGRRRELTASGNKT